MMHRTLPLLASLTLALAAAPGAGAQSLTERLDEEQLLRGLAERGLGDLLDHYISANPPADAVQSARYRIAAARLALAGGGLTPAERLDAVERMLRVRAELIEAHPDDPQRALWLADQAADLYFELLPIDASGLTTLFGVPSAAQRDRTVRVAEQMNRLAAEAEREIQRAIVAIERAPGYAGSDALKQERRRLIEDQRDRRIPLLRGVGAFLAARLAIGEGDEQRELLALARGDLVPLAERLEQPSKALAQLYGGLAHADLGESDSARAVLRALAGDGAAPPIDRFTADLALARLAPDESTTLAALDSLSRRVRDDLLQRLLVADQLFLVRRGLAMSEQDPARRSAALAEAWDAYVTLLRDAPAGERDIVRALIAARAAAASGPQTPLDELPPLVAIARASALAEQPQELDAAIALYEQVLGRGDLADADEVQALLGMGQALHRAGRTGEAAERFLEMAERHVADPAAERAIEAAAALAAAERQRHPHDEPARRRLLDVLDVLLTRYPNLATADRWRYLSGRVALDERRFGDARSAFTQVARDADEWLDSRFMLVNALRVQWEAAPPGDRPPLGMQIIDEAGEAREALAAALRSGVPAERAAELRYYQAWLRIFVAEAHLAGNRPQDAVAVLDGVEDDRGLEGVVVAAALRARIDAYEAMGRPAEARREVQRYVEAAPEQVDQVILPMLASMLEEVEQLVAISREEVAQQRAEEDLVPLAAMLEQWLAQHEGDPQRTPALRKAIADAYRYAGRWNDALAQYDDLITRYGDALELLLGRAESLYGLGGDQLAEAITIYKRIAALGAERAGRDYWLAELRILQILERVGRNTHRINPQIERLRQKDPTLGGDRFRRQFDALQKGERESRK